MTDKVTPQATDIEVKAVETGDKQEDSHAENLVPQKRFGGVVKERNEALEQVTRLQAQLDGFNLEKQRELDRDLERKGEFEILANRYKQENASLRTKIDSVNDYELEQRALLTGRLPENKRDFANDMGLVALARFVDVEEKTKITPREDATPGKRFGGYDNLAEFATKDPMGYKAAKEAGEISKWRKG